MCMFLKRNALPCVESMTSFNSEFITNTKYSVNMILDPWVEGSSDLEGITRHQRTLELPAEFRGVI